MDMDLLSQSLRSNTAASSKGPASPRVKPTSTITVVNADCHQPLLLKEVNLDEEDGPTSSPLLRPPATRPRRREPDEVSITRNTVSQCPIVMLSAAGVQCDSCSVMDQLVALCDDDDATTVEEVMRQWYKGCSANPRAALGFARAVEVLKQLEKPAGVAAPGQPRELHNVHASPRSYPVSPRRCGPPEEDDDAGTSTNDGRNRRAPRRRKNTPPITIPAGCGESSLADNTNNVLTPPPSPPLAWRDTAVSLEGGEPRPSFFFEIRSVPRRGGSSPPEPNPGTPQRALLSSPPHRSSGTPVSASGRKVLAVIRRDHSMSPASRYDRGQHRTNTRQEYRPYSRATRWL